MLPNEVMRNPCFYILAFHCYSQDLVIVTVQSIIIEAFSSNPYVFIKVLGFLKVEIILPIFWAIGNKLPIDGLNNLSKHGFNMREEIFIRLLSSKFCSILIIEAKSISQFFRRTTDRRIDVASSEPFYRERMNNS